MARETTFARKIALGFAGAVVLTLSIGAVAIFALRSVTASKDAVIQRDVQLMVGAERLRTGIERKSSASRAFLLGRAERFVEELNEGRRGFTEVVGHMKGLLHTPEGERLLEAIVEADAQHERARDQVIEFRRTDATPEAVQRLWEELTVPTRAVLDRNVKALVDRDEKLLEEARAASNDTATSAIELVIAIAVIAALFAIGIAVFLGRGLGRQIGTAVGQVQSSSAELQSSATEQATGSREQATAMNEVSTTMSELLATSRQIAESAQRVAQIADQTAGAARSGEGTVELADQSIGGIRRHVDLVVTHMLELGKKSQQIGSVLDIVSELAEQTNILSINATIEAAGAGEGGKRFAVVADEIRKLSDRVTGSAKEIRGLIDEVRAAVNTTVMATETMSKAVDGGSRQFGDVAGSFKQIGGMVMTTTQAAREIELSTKQQTTAVEQVNVAINNVAQATRENETSSSQTLQTASQLAGLSRDLLRLVEPQGMARA
ncbi:MAG TPA: methyl-accepting chemotaxis protein [Kofleriaceae bacterium]|nr:methyl-accepting chemotaxis protein [Kofleriaceae bacterium]